MFADQNTVAAGLIWLQYHSILLLCNYLNVILYYHTVSLCLPSYPLLVPSLKPPSAVNILCCNYSVKFLKLVLMDDLSIAYGRLQYCI